LIDIVGVFYYLCRIYVQTFLFVLYKFNDDEIIQPIID